MTIGQSGSYLVLARGEVARESGDELELWSLDVAQVDAGLSARTGVWLGPVAVESALSSFFEDIASDWQGWQGAKEWRAVEGGLQLSCNADRLGHIAITVVLSSGAAVEGGWLVEANIKIDAGQLDQLATDVRRLFAVG